MRFRLSFSLVSRGVLVLALLGVGDARVGAQGTLPSPGLPASAQVPALKGVSLIQRLDNAIPLDTPFVDESGRDVKLGDYFGSRPVVLALVYYQCPMLCTQVLHGLVSALEALQFNAGREFEVVVVSFDPGETPAMAAAKRRDFIQRYQRKGIDGGVHFLTGRPAAIDALTDAVGFHYSYDPAIDQYAHPAQLTILTAAGHVARYLIGIDFAPRELRLALVEAADNKIGTVLDQALLLCYHYDPETGKYGFAITNVVRGAGLLTVLGLGAFILMNLRRERRQGSAVHATATGTR